MQNINKAYFIAWILAIFGTLCSIVIGEVMGFEPCPLCWYQRMCLFPLVILIGIGLLRKERSAFFYTFVFPIIGILLSFYQFAYPKLLPYFGVIPVCTYGKDCFSSPFEFFGFINVAFLSLVNFTLLLILLLVGYFLDSNTDRKDISES